MRDLTDPRLLYLKGGLFLLLGTLAAALLLGDAPQLRTMALLAITVWAFARAYYFAFYVLERYVEPSLRFPGVVAAISHLRAARLVGLRPHLKEICMDTKSIGEQLVSLCREGKNLEAISNLYSPDIVSVESQGPPGMPLESRGIDAVRGKNEWWLSSHEIHSAMADGPFVNGDSFSAIFEYEVTPKEGPMAGKRNHMKEVAVYDVKDGKIVHELFYY
jgi:hypothetical protein